MGIDSQMLIRGVKREIVTSDWLKEQSFYMCTALGAGNFMLSRHPAITMTCDYDDEYNAISNGKHYMDDGPAEFEAFDWECLLEVHLWSRYYGVGYERGNLPIIVATAEWVEQNIEGAEVYYGGDSSGVEMKRFGRSEREELKRHFYSKDGRNYSFFADKGPIAEAGPSACELCPYGSFNGRKCGFSGDGSYSAYHCTGCGKTFTSRDHKKTWANEDEKQSA